MGWDGSGRQRPKKLTTKAVRVLAAVSATHLQDVVTNARKAMQHKERVTLQQNDMRFATGRERAPKRLLRQGSNETMIYCRFEQEGSEPGDDFLNEEPGREPPLGVVVEGLACSKLFQRGVVWHLH